MQTNFKNLPQVLDFFKDERNGLEYLEQQRWNGNPICPHCETPNPYRTATRSKRPELKGTFDYKCRNKDCHKKFTVISGTILENSKISLRNWLAAMYLCTNHKKGISSCQLARDLGITQKTAWFLLHRIREMLRSDAPVMLEGNVQVDEAYFGGKKGNKHQSQYNRRENRVRLKKLQKIGIKGKAGRGSDRPPVIGLIETKGNVAAYPVPKVIKANIFPLIAKHAHRNAVMVTDDFRIYKKIPQELGFQHEYVNHKYGEYVKRGYHTNSIEGFWSQMKRGIYGIYHQVSEKHLQRYCDEFVFRHNTRLKIDINRFEQSVERIGGKRLTYANLIKD
jgi:transposase-like protein